MNANMRRATKRYVIGITAMTIIAMVFLSLLPATAGPGPIGATVMGTVTDTNDGEPIEGALVVIGYHGTDTSTLTDENGKYMFTNVPECFCLKTIKVTKDGYRPETDDVAVSGITVVDFELLFMELEPYEGTVMGTVTDNHDGQPMEGVQVTIEYHETLREAYTDSEGKYRFDQVPVCFCLKKVTATQEHFRPETKEVGVEGITVVDFQLWVEEKSPNDGGTVSGTVTDAETGEPIEGALVVVEHDGQLKKALTDGNGHYMVTGIEMCFCLKDITVSADGYGSQEASIAVDVDTVLDIALDPVSGQGTIIPDIPIREAPESMQNREYAMAGLVGAGIGLAGVGYFAFMARE
jgi:protocatechuate 3,4-dioxygenase beta subunit